MKTPDSTDLNIYEQAAHFLNGTLNPGKLLEEAGKEVRELQEKYDAAILLSQEMFERANLYQKKVKELEEMLAELKGE